MTELLSAFYENTAKRAGIPVVPVELYDCIVFGKRTGHGKEYLEKCVKQLRSQLTAGGICQKVENMVVFLIVFLYPELFGLCAVIPVDMAGEVAVAVFADETYLAVILAAFVGGGFRHGIGRICAEIRQL